MNESKQTLAEKYRLELLWMLIKRNLKIRYNGSALGFLWSLFTPLSQILIYVIFAKILKFGGPGYIQYLVGGIILWQFTAGCLNDSLYAIVGNTNLVKKVFFPRILLPLSTALATGINFLIAFAVLIPFLILTNTAEFHFAYLALAIVLHLLLGIGLCCICSCMNVFFRDTQHWIGIFSQVWFFLTPVFYGFDLQIDAMKDKFASLPATLVYLNPMTGILSAYRMGLMKHEINPLSFGAPPGALHSPWIPYGMSSICISAAVCIAVFIIGLAVLRSSDRRFGDVL